MEIDKDELLDDLNKLKQYMSFILYKDIDVKKTVSKLDKLINHVEKDKTEKYLKNE